MGRCRTRGRDERDRGHHAFNLRLHAEGSFLARLIARSRAGWVSLAFLDTWCVAPMGSQETK
jgi:hypothetical protein